MRLKGARFRNAEQPESFNKSSFVSIQAIVAFDSRWIDSLILYRDFYLIELTRFSERFVAFLSEKNQLIVATARNRWSTMQLNPTPRKENSAADAPI